MIGRFELMKLGRPADSFFLTEAKINACSVHEIIISSLLEDLFFIVWTLIMLKIGKAYKT